jgi:ATP-binding cassette, subfamily B, bacterial MsbA
MDSSNLFRRLLKFIPWFSNQPGFLALGIISLLVTSAIEPAIPAMMKPLLDNGFTQGKLEIWKVPAILVSLFFIRGFAGFLANYCFARVTNASMVTIRKKLFEKLQAAQTNIFIEKHASSLTNTIIYEVNSGASVLTSTIIALTKDTLTVISLLAYLLYLNWQLTSIVFLIIPPIIWIVKRLLIRLDKVARESQNAVESLAYVVEENVLSHRIVRLHNAQKNQVNRFDSYNRKLGMLALKNAITSAAITPTTQILAALSLSSVVTYALIQSQTEGSVTVGSFAAFITGMLMLISPIKHLSDVAGSLTKGITALERGLELLNKFENEYQGTYSKENTSGDIEFKDISLKYPGSDDFALNGISLSIKSGETIALVGPSGSGKSTLVNLLPRFIEPSSGEITIDGVSIKSWNLTSLRNQIAYVSQDVVMLNDTIASNIALGDASPDKEKVWSALKVANLDAFVQSLPLREMSIVGHNATKLSGGQRQRLAIARAIYKNAPILVLDEATSALDNESEQNIKDALKTLMKGRTTLIIAHRLSTIEHADRIAVVQQGKILEIGTHFELLKNKNLYSAFHSLEI